MFFCGTTASRFTSVHALPGLPSSETREPHWLNGQSAHWACIGAAMVLSGLMPLTDWQSGLALEPSTNDDL